MNEFVDRRFPQQRSMQKISGCYFRFDRSWLVVLMCTAKVGGYGYPLHPIPLNPCSKKFKPGLHFIMCRPAGRFVNFPLVCVTWVTKPQQCVNEPRKPALTAMSSKVTIHLQEGASINYFESLQATFGGAFTEEGYEFTHGKTDIRFYNFPVMPGFDMLMNSATHTQPVEMIRTPDNNPDLFHFYLLKKGQFGQNFNQRRQFMEAGTSTGVFISNGMFPMHAQFPAHVTLKSVGFKITRTAIQQLLPEARQIGHALFSDTTPVAYHTHLSPQLKLLMEDMFLYNEIVFGKKALIMSRAIELFTRLMGTLEKLQEKDELNGLHVEDYNRMLDLKEYLLNNLDKRVSMQALASEFGVSLSKLKRDFNTLFSTSVYKFHTHAKMDEAYRRLQTGNYSVMEVGYDLGYSNPSKFSQMFKKVKGINPGEVGTL